MGQSEFGPRNRDSLPHPAISKRNAGVTLWLACAIMVGACTSQPAPVRVPTEPASPITPVQDAPEDALGSPGSWKVVSDPSSQATAKKGWATYVGELENNKFNGVGELYEPTGATYAGSWTNGRRHGHGRQTYADGSWFEGEWEYNRPLGPGIRSYPCGHEISAVWNGDVASNGILVLPSGQTFAGPLTVEDAEEDSPKASPQLAAWLHDKAKLGDPHAAYLLAEFADTGQLTHTKTDINSKGLLRSSVNRGSSCANLKLGKALLSDQPEEAAALFQKAASQGNAEAQELLGDLSKQRGSISDALTNWFAAAEAGRTSAKAKAAEILVDPLSPDTYNPASAIEILQGIAIYLGEWQYLAIVAAAHAELSQHKQARRYLSEAIRLLEEDDPSSSTLVELRERHASFSDQTPPPSVQE